MDEHGITAICSKCSTLLTFTEDSLLRCVKCCVEYGPKSHVYDEQFPEHSPLLEQQRERLLEQQRRKEDGDPIKSPQGRGNPKEDGNPIESPQNDTNRLLRQIEENTRRTKEVSEKFLFWFITLPLVIGAIILITQGCD
jgi:hypothetical protein